MRVLVTGATGLVGSHVARALTEAGHAVRVLVRASSKLDNLAGLPFERVEGDVTDAGTLPAAVAGCEAVVHTAGVASWSPLDTQRIHEVNVGGVTSVLRAAKAAGVKRAVVTASVAAIGGSAVPEILSEESSWDRVGRLAVPYMTSKRQGMEAAFAEGTPAFEVVCVCPSFVLGPGDVYASSASIVLAVARGKLPSYVDGGTSVVDVRDVAAGHVAALERGRPGERYILAGDNISMTTLMARVSAYAGVPMPRLVPVAAAKPAALLADLAARLTGRRQPLSSGLLKASSLYTFASSAKAARELGYTFRPSETSLRDTLAYFLRVGRLKAETPALRALAAEVRSGA